MAASTAMLPTWYRALAVIVGVFSISLAIIAMAFPGLALWLLIFLLGFALLMIGIDRIITGISGHPYSVMIAGITPGGPAGTSAAPSAPEKKP
jgi:uncharacterized membrane protein HdeD (DUF308 family)